MLSGLACCQSMCRSHCSPFFFFSGSAHRRDLHSFPTRRSSDLTMRTVSIVPSRTLVSSVFTSKGKAGGFTRSGLASRSEEHTSELQSQFHLVCRLLLEKKKTLIETARTAVHSLAPPGPARRGSP